MKFYKSTTYFHKNEKNVNLIKKNCFHLRDFTKKKFPKMPCLYSRLFGKLKKFPYKELFPFDGFPFTEDELYLQINA